MEFYPHGYFLIDSFMKILVTGSYLGGGYEDLEGEDEVKAEFFRPFCGFAQKPLALLPFVVTLTKNILSKLRMGLGVNGSGIGATPKCVAVVSIWLIRSPTSSKTVPYSANMLGTAVNGRTMVTDQAPAATTQVTQRLKQSDADCSWSLTS